MRMPTDGEHLRSLPGILLLVAFGMTVLYTNVYGNRVGLELPPDLFKILIPLVQGSFVLAIISSLVFFYKEVKWAKVITIAALVPIFLFALFLIPETYNRFHSATSSDLFRQKHGVDATASLFVLAGMIFYQMYLFYFLARVDISEAKDEK